MWRDTRTRARARGRDRWVAARRCLPHRSTIPSAPRPGKNRRAVARAHRRRPADITYRPRRSARLPPATCVRNACLSPLRAPAGCSWSCVLPDTAPLAESCACSRPCTLWRSEAPDRNGPHKPSPLCRSSTDGARRRSAPRERAARVASGFSTPRS